MHAGGRKTNDPLNAGSLTGNGVIEQARHVVVERKEEISPRRGMGTLLPFAIDLQIYQLDKLLH